MLRLMTGVTSTCVGPTHSSDFPVEKGFDTTFGGNEEWSCRAFLVKFDLKGELVWATFLSGSDYSSGTAVAIDKLGRITVTGNTTAYDFPTKNALIDELNQWSWADRLLAERWVPEDAFVTQMSDSGELLWSTYWGGGETDIVYSIAVDWWGHVYIDGTS